MKNKKLVETLKIIDNIEEARNIKDISITRLTKDVGISRECYYNIKSKRNIPNLDTAIRLARKVGLDSLKIWSM